MRTVNLFLKIIIMEEKNFLVISLVRDLTDGTLLVIRKKEERCRPTQDAFPSSMKPKNVMQTAIRATYEATGITIKKPVEVARVKVEVQVFGADNSYEAVFVLSTEFTGSLHPASETDVVWQKEEELKLESTIPAYILRQVLDGKYLSGTYNYADDEFTTKEIRDL